MIPIPVSYTHLLLHEGLDICSDPDGPAAYDTALRSDIQMIEELRGTGAFTELGVKMNSVKWMRRCV